MTMQLFGEGRTDAIFQFESSGMQEICRKLKPKSIEDLSALNALYRPGPVDGGMVEDFILRHHGKKSVRHIVPEMKEILDSTQGVIGYQEQAMQLAQKLAGYTMAEADSLRKAMGKKNREEMAQQEQKFILGAVARGIKRDKAQQIFSLMAQFADYGFPKAHSVAYAYLAFQTGYLKAHYGEHFYAAVLSNEIDDTAKVFRYTKEMRAQAIGQDDLFGGDLAQTADAAGDLPAAAAWTASEMLAAEKKAVGFYVTGHPLEAHFELVAKLGAVTSAELSQQESGSRATIAGLITDLQLRTTKKGDRFAIFRLEDQAGSVKCVLWPEPFRRQGAIVADEATVLVNGRAEISEDGVITVIAERLTELTQAVQQKARETLIAFPAMADSAQLSETVKSLLEKSKGDCDVFVEVTSEGMLVRVRAHPSLKVRGSAEIESALRNLGCEVRWEGFAARQAAAAPGSA